MVPISFAIALTVNTVGISGAALFVPFFALIFPLIGEPLTALQSVKLGLITESFGLSSSAIAFFIYGLVDKRLAGFSILGALPLVILGAFLANFIPESVLLFIVAIALISSIFMIKHEKTLRTARAAQHKKNHIDLSVKEGHLRKLQSIDGQKFSYCLTKPGYEKRFLGFGIGGLFQGAAGFGIGEMGIISMMITKIPIRIAIGTSHFIVASTAITASLIHIFATSALGAAIPWNIIFMTVPSVILGGQLAPVIAAKLPAKYLEQFISILFIIIAIALVILVFQR